MRQFIKISLAVLVLATLAWADTPWTSKPYQQWDQKDVARVMNDSPWTRLISVMASWETRGMTGSRTRTGNEQQSEGLGGGGQSSMGGGPGSRRRGGMNMPMQREAQFRARWISARTMRKAMARMEVLEGKVRQPDAARFVAQAPKGYQLLIFGPDMSPFQGVKDADLAKDFSLEAKKSKQKVLASSAKLQRSANGKRLLAVTVSFPRSVGGKPVVGAGEKSIEVVCHLKDATLKFHFDPRKMKDKQGSDL